MKKIKKIFIIFLLLSSFCLAKTQQEEYKNDTLYSEEYFDYLIECASYTNQEADTETKVDSEIKISDESTIEQAQKDVIFEDYEPFKLRIENKSIAAYTEYFKKDNTKTTIPISSKFNLIQNTTKFKNKYNSNDYRMLVGGELNLNKYINISSGIETNYRNLDQIPISRKLYITPTLKLSNKLSVSFYNKINTLTGSSDHDIGIDISPFKSNVIDMGIYAGLTHEQTGELSESLSFSANLYF